MPSAPRAPRSPVGAFSLPPAHVEDNRFHDGVSFPATDPRPTEVSPVAEARAEPVLAAEVLPSPAPELTAKHESEEHEPLLLRRPKTKLPAAVPRKERGEDEPAPSQSRSSVVQLPVKQRGARLVRLAAAAVLIAGVGYGAVVLWSSSVQTSAAVESPPLGHTVEAIEVQAPSTTEIAELLTAAEEMRARGQLTEAESIAVQAVERAPNRRQGRVLLAEIRILQHDGAAAMEALESLPLDDPAVIRLGAQAALLDGTESALESASARLSNLTATDEHADDVELQALQIALLLRRGENESASSLADALLRRAQAHPAALLAIGQAQLQTGNLNEALDYARRAADGSPELADTHYMLGLVHRVRGELAAAHASHQQALTIDPNHPHATVARGYLRLDQGEYEQAERHFRDALSSSSPDRSWTRLAQFGLVRALIGQGRMDEAERRFATIDLEARSGFTGTLVQAELWHAQGEYRDAARHLRPVVSGEMLSDVGADAIVLYGDTLLAARSEGASRTYDRALVLDPEHPVALLGRASTHFRASAYRDAKRLLDQLDRALQDRPHAPDLRARALLLRARVFMSESEPDLVAARSLLREASEIVGVPDEVWFWLGESLARVNSPESRQAYERYLELRPEGMYSERARAATL